MGGSIGSHITTLGTGMVGTSSQSSRSASSVSAFPSNLTNSTRTKPSSAPSSIPSSFTPPTIRGTAPTSKSLNATSHRGSSITSGASSGFSFSAISSSSPSSRFSHLSLSKPSSLSANSSVIQTSTRSDPLSTSFKSTKDHGQTTSIVSTNLGPGIFTKTVVETGTSGTFTTVIPVLSGGDVTSAIPITATAVGWLNPSGTEASSSAASIQSQIVLLVPLIKSYIDNPNKPKATDAINSINKIRPLVDNLLSDLDSSDSKSQKSCSVSTNLITDLFNAVKCAADNLEKASNDIKDEIGSNFDDLSEIESTLENLEGLEDGLDEENKQTQSASQKSQSKTSASRSTSATKSCTSSSIAEDIYVDCVSTQAPGRARQVASSCITSTKTISGCDLTAITTTTTEAAACSLPPKTSPSSIPGPIYTAWWDFGVFCAGSDCGDYTNIPSFAIVPSGTYVSNITSTSPPTNSLTSTQPASSKTGASSHLPSSTHISPTTSSPPSSTAPAKSTSTSLSCAPTVNTAVPSGIAQSDMQDAVIDYCKYISNTMGLTNTNDELPYYEPGGIVRLNFTSQFNVTEAICSNALGTVVNGCPPFSVPSGQTLDKWGGAFFMKNETGGMAKFQIGVGAAEAVS